MVMNLFQKYQEACLEQYQIANALFTIKQATKILSDVYAKSPWVKSYNITSSSYLIASPLNHWTSYKVFSSLLKCLNSTDAFWYPLQNDLGAGVNTTLYKDPELFLERIDIIFKNLDINRHFEGGIQAVCADNAKVHNLQQYCQFNSYLTPQLDQDLKESGIYSIYCTAEYIYFVCDHFINH